MNSCIRPSLLTTKVRPRPKIRLGQDGFAGWIEIPTRLRLNQRRNFPRCSSRGIDGKKTRTCSNEEGTPGGGGQLSTLCGKNQRNFIQARQAVAEPNMIEVGKNRRGNENQPVYIVPKREKVVSLLPSGALRKLFARCPIRPACCLAPSQQSFPQAICTVPCPSSMLSRSFPAKLSASYLHGFLSVQHAVALPPSRALRKLFAPFPIRPACCLAPSQQSSPQAICTVSCPSSILSRSLPEKIGRAHV